MVDFGLRNTQLTLAYRYHDYLERIYNHMRSTKKILDVSTLAKELAIYKQQVSPVVAKLISANLVKFEMKGRNKCISLTEDGIKLYSEWYQSEKKSPITPIIKPMSEKDQQKLNRAVEEFNIAPNGNARRIAMTQMNNTIMHIANQNILLDWSTVKLFSDVVNDFFTNPEKYDNLDSDTYVKDTFFYTILRTYQIGYMDLRNFEALMNFFVNKKGLTVEKDANLINSIMAILIAVMKNHPEISDKVPYQLFILILEKVRYWKRDYVFFVQNNRDDIKQLTDPMKKRMVDDCYRIIKVENKDITSKDELINELLTILNQG